MAVLTTTKTNVNNGFLVLDYTSGTDPISTVNSLLKAAYGSGGSSAFLSGQIYDSNATAGRIGLGSWDNPTTHQVTIMPAVYGDLLGNGTKVGTQDLLTLLNNWNQSGLGWAGGNFTYSGTVGTSDLLLLLNNWNQQGPFSLGNVPALAFQSIAADGQVMAALARDDITIGGASPVPEPSSIVMLAGLAIMGLAWGIGRQRRKVAA